jgi:Flp pilus assembly pilin Flp
MLLHIKELFYGQEGQGMAEYALILAFVALVVITALPILAGSIKTQLTNVVTGLGGTVE